MRVAETQGGSLLLLLLLLLVDLTAARQAAHAAGSSRWGKDYLPNVIVLDQDGKEQRFYDDVLRGKITVISFIYTSCASICPLVIARLAEVQDDLGGAAGRDIFFVSISIDPIPDTPEKLKEHKEAFAVGPGWSFLTGDIENIDLIRHKLGERSGKAIAQHKNEVLLYNDTTGEWARDSAFSDLGVLTHNIREMNPVWRAAGPRPAEVAPADLHSSGPGQAGQALFIKACAACHSIGGGVKVGPDLAGLTARRSRKWISAYIRAPDRMRRDGDPFALDLRKSFPAVRMPNLSLSEDDTSDLISYIEMRQSAASHAARD